MKQYEVLVKTNCYAGNFEREMCAFMTGQIGECTVGEELVDETIASQFEEVVRQEPDDHGCHRPVELDDDINNFIIFFYERPTPEQLKLMTERAELFEKTRPYKYLDKEFKFLGLEENEVVTEKRKL